MLVKFISFIISVFGTKRYKPILLTGLAVASVVVGVGAVVSVYKSPPHTAASTVDQDTGRPSSNSSSEKLSKQGLQKQVPAQPTQTPPAATSPDAPAATPAPTKSPELALSKESPLIVKRGTSSDLLTATVSDSSKLQWSITAENAPAGLSIQTTDSTEPSIQLSFTIKADTSLTSGTYSVIINGKDSGRGLSLTKTISVIVPTE